MNYRSVMGRPLADGDISNAAEKLGVSSAHVRAVVEVEAKDSGFIGRYENDPRLPKILFEAHIFSRHTNGKFNHSHPHISSQKWDRSLYLGGVREYDRLREAATLDFQAAYSSASWGLFQIMGFNHEAAGYSTLLDFIGAQHISEGMQLDAGVNFIRDKKLHLALKKEDWAKFARTYNGPGYKENSYDEKLARAYERYSSSKKRVFENDVAKLQDALNRAGFNLLVDGIIGSRTEVAVREFQEREGLPVDGVAGPQTREKLGI
jgi:peptidoglycan hydrolase-like protein with peptidoglycan-binding domain